jgi:hypothetical protein
MRSLIVREMALFIFCSVFVIGCGLAKTDRKYSADYFSEIVGDALVWEEYWKSPFDNMGVPPLNKKSDIKYICFINGDDMMVFIDDYLCVLNFQRHENRWLYYEAVVYNETKITPQNNKRDYAEYKNRMLKNAHVKTTELRKLNLEVINPKGFSEVKVELVKKVFIKNILTNEFKKFVYQVSKAGSQKPVSIRVGDFNVDNSLMYYYVKDLDYCGRVFINPVNHQVIHEEFESYLENPNGIYLENIIKRIDENGRWFIYHNGKFVSER